MIREIFAGALCLVLAAPLGAAQAPAADKEEDMLVDSLWPKLRDLPADRRPRVALVLGGGGARGLAHIGVLKVLAQEKVPVDMIIGTSVGALIGALYAAGLSIDQIERMGKDIGWDKLTNLSPGAMVKLLMKDQLLSTQKMEEYLNRHMGKKQFADLKIPFACVATDLKTGEQIVLREGSVSLAARASATMPGFFMPVPYRHRFLVDGGVVNNVPTDVAQILGADVILCVPVPADFSEYNVSNVLNTMTQALYIQGEVITKERLAKADVLIQPQVQDVTAAQLWKSKECIAAGEAAGVAALPDIRRALVKKFFDAWAREPL